jgi:hypothetical protein
LLSGELRKCQSAEEKKQHTETETAKPTVLAEQPENVQILVATRFRWVRVVVLLQFLFLGFSVVSVPSDIPRSILRRPGRSGVVVLFAIHLALIESLLPSLCVLDPR